MPELVDIIKKRLEEIQGCIIAHRTELKDWEIRKARHLAPEKYEFTTDWKPIKVGEIWGYPGETVFFRNKIKIPTAWQGKRVALQLETGGEGLLYLNGKPYHGIDDNRSYILLTPAAQGGEVFEVSAEMKVGGYWNWTDETKSVGKKPYLFTGARLIVVDRQVEEAYFDFHLAHEAAVAVKDGLLREAILQGVKSALSEVDFRDKTLAVWKEALVEARKKLRAELGKISFADTPGRVFFTGHSHIDVAWLWPLRETIRKCGRTYSTVMALMDEYPYYHFNCSQVPLFLFTKRYYPSLYERIKQRVAEGRFEPIGGTWVEHDTNLLSGESLVRQCLYGKRFFRKEFGIDVRVGWLPDVFGYTWSLPQIYSKAGLEYFMTSKLSWNDTNKFPFGTFWWEGIDGTRLFTHLICGTYNAMVTPGETLTLWQEYPSKLQSPEFLSSFGYGDGGGGPTREMLEAVPRMAELPGIPKAGTGRVHDFFARIAAQTKDLPVWNGELYLELHRGTYTTQVRNKRANRKSELLYREVELLSALAMLYGRPYPVEKIKNNWETILINHFHDIIPGSSVRAVYEESQAQYAQVIKDGEEERLDALVSLLGRVDTTGEGIPVAVINTLSWERTDLATVEVPDNKGNYKVVDSEGKGVWSQQTEGTVTFLASKVPSMGYRIYHLVPGEPVDDRVFTVEGNIVTTPFYKVKIEEDGTFSYIYDKINKREILPSGTRGNVLQFFEDKPTNWEAWDVEPQYQEKFWEAEVEEPLRVVEKGPTRLVMSGTLKYGKSRIQQKIIFYAHTPRIDFSHQVDWRERKTLLKVAFPVEVRSSKATYEIAFGAIERPTHQNTSWDRAKFEVPGHKWADLSEADYGVSLLNDSKYGWDIQGQVIRLSLLRSPEQPDPQADQGEQYYTYALYPHTGDWKNGTVQEGYALNIPLLAAVTETHPGCLAKVHSFFHVDRENVIIDTVKKAEDSDEIILRVYEAYGARGPATLGFDRPVDQALECNLLEEGEQPVTIEEQKIKFYIKPFEIKTFRVKFK